MPTSRQKPSEDVDEVDDDRFHEDYYIFRPGSLPPQKQMFYQVGCTSFIVDNKIDDLD